MLVGMKASRESSGTVFAVFVWFLIRQQQQQQQQPKQQQQQQGRSQFHVG